MPAGENLGLRRRVPAWALSLGLHALLLTALASGLRPVLSQRLEPPPRPVGIVLAPAPTAGSYQRDELLPQPDPPDPPDAAGPQAAVAAALPSAQAAAELELPAVSLPGLDAPVPGSGELLPELDLGRRQGRTAIGGSGDDAIWAEEASRQAARRALGASTEVSIFGSAPAVGRSFVFAIDRSHSMGGQGLNALAAARGELSRAVAQLAENHRFQIVAYHHQCVYLGRPRLLPATPEHKAQVAPFIDGLAALGGTGHETAIRAALAMEPDVLFVLTDGGDPHLNEIQLANLRKLAEGRTAIHTLQFGFGAAPEASFLRRLAEQNRGSHTYVDMSALHFSRRVGYSGCLRLSGGRFRPSGPEAGNWWGS